MRNWLGGKRGFNLGIPQVHFKQQLRPLKLGKKAASKALGGRESEAPERKMEQNLKLHCGVLLR